LSSRSTQATRPRFIRAAWTNARTEAKAASTRALASLDASGLARALANWKKIKAEPLGGKSKAAKQSQADFKAGAKEQAGYAALVKGIEALKSIPSTLLAIAESGDGAEQTAAIDAVLATDPPAALASKCAELKQSIGKAQAVAEAVNASREAERLHRLDEALGTVSGLAQEPEEFVEPARERSDFVKTVISNVQAKWDEAAGLARGKLAARKFDEARETAQAFTKREKHRGVRSVETAALTLVNAVDGALSKFLTAFEADRAIALDLARQGDPDAATAKLQPYIDSDQAAIAARAKAVVEEARFEADRPEGFRFVPAGEESPPIYVMEREVTNAEFAEFIAAMRTEGDDRPAPRHWGGDQPAAEIADHPVRWVSRADAIAYADWRSRTVGARFRLPTEAEWELAARGPAARALPWGDDAEVTAMVVGTGATAAAGSLDADATPEGLRGLGGNVAEWTSSAADVKAVFRGGSFDAWAKRDPLARVVVRAGAVALPTVGFRLVRDVRR